MRRHGIAAALLVAMACGETLPRYRDIEDIRVIAIKAEPPEVFVDAKALLTGGPLSVDVSFEALVLDPRGGEIEYAWSICPFGSGLACTDYDERRTDTEVRMLEAATELPVDPFVPTYADVGRIFLEIDRIRAEVETGTALPRDQVQTPQPLYWWSERGVWPHAVPAFDFSGARELAELHFFDNLFGVGTGAWPSAILDLTKGTERLRTQKRFVLNVSDRKEIAVFLLSKYGYVVCSDTPDDPPDCLPLEDATPNSNPAFEKVQFAYGDSSDVDTWYDLSLSPDRRVAGVLWLPARQQARLLPSFTEASFEAYQVLRVDLQTQVIGVEDRVEEISVTWFVSDGDVQDGITWPKFTKSLDTVFTAPAQPGRVTIWLVARDQRGGTEWMSVEIQVD